MHPNENRSSFAVPPSKQELPVFTTSQAEPSAAQSSRVTVVDALRGFAIMSIMLLHNLEHFDFYFFPKYLPAWIKALDAKIWNTLFFLFSGKSYAIFALLFGFTFFIMFNKQQKRGLDFRGRFLWRLAILLIFGIINSIFYEGDILALYAVLGVSLVLVCRWSDTAVLVAAITLLLQPVELGKIVYIFNTPDYVAPAVLSNHYFSLTSAYLSGSSFWAQAVGNLWNGRAACTLWSYENGRFFQACALFMMGMLLARRGAFAAGENNRKFWRRALAVSVISFLFLLYFKSVLPKLAHREALSNQLGATVSTWANFALMATWVSSFVLLYQTKACNRILAKLEPFGRMSLTNYITQSMLGSVIYYGYGFGLYKYTGATFCLLIGATLFLLQLALCNWWLKHHKQGPLEAIWHRLTWIGEKKPSLAAAIS